MLVEKLYYDHLIETKKSISDSMDIVKFLSWVWLSIYIHENNVTCRAYTDKTSWLTKSLMKIFLRQQTVQVNSDSARTYKNKYGYIRWAKYIIIQIEWKEYNIPMKKRRHWVLEIQYNEFKIVCP